MAPLLLFFLPFDGVMFVNFHKFMDGLVDEDERDKTGETLLREASEVFDHRAGVCGYQNDAHQRSPQANPEAERQIV